MENQSTAGGLAAGVVQFSTANGAAVVQWDSADLEDRLWKIVRITDSTHL